MDPTIKAEILCPYQSAAEAAISPIDPNVPAELSSVGEFFKAGKSSELLKAANAAISKAVDSGSKQGQAKGLHAISLASVLTDDYETASKKAQEAVAIYRESNATEDLAFELQALASYYLAQDKPQKALPLAQEAWLINKDRGSDTAASVYLTVQSLIGKYQRKRAVKTAKDAMASLTDDKGAAIGTEALVKAYLSLDATGDAAEVLSSADKTVNNLMLSCSVSLASGDYDACYSSLDNVLSLAQGDLKIEASALVERAKVAISKKDVSEAVQAAQDAKSVFSKLGDASGEARCLLLTAYANSLEMQYDTTIEQAKQAKDAYMDAGDMPGACLALGLTVEVFILMNQPDQAKRSAQERLSLYEDYGSKKGMGKAMCSIASVLSNMGNLAEAEDMANKSLANAKAAWDMRSMLSSTNTLTKVYLFQLSKYADYDGQDLQMKPPKQFTALREKARSSANRAVVFSGKVQDKGLRATALFLRANVLTWCFLSDKALQSATEAAKLYQDTGNEQGEASALTFCIDLHLAFNGLDKAKECAETALQITRDLQDIAMEEQVLEAWERIDEKEFGKAVVVEYQSAPQMVAAVPGATQQAVVAQGGGASVAVAAKPKMDPVATGKKLMELVINVMASDEDVQADSPLMEAGMDSLSSVQFVNEVSREFQMSFSPSLVFDFPTVSSLTNHIIESAS